MLLTGLSGFLISCNTLPAPPDVYAFEHLNSRTYTDDNGKIMFKPSPTCMEKIGEVECGHGVSIVTGNQIYVGENEPNLFNKKPWSQVRAESIYLPAEESYAPISVYIINNCIKFKCSDAVTRFKVKVDTVDPKKGN